MQRIAALTLTALLAGCASGSGSIPEARTDRAIVPVEVSGATSTVEIARTAAIASEAVAAPAARVWALLPAVYAEMEIPVASMDAEAMVIGSGSQRLRRVGGKQVASWFRCSGAYENLAMSGDVYVTVRTQLFTVGGGTEARTEVSAWAQSRSGSRVNCGSNGTLEQAVGAKIRERAATAS
jgi:hypothetical protein